MKKTVVILGLAAIVLASGCFEPTGAGPRSEKGPLFRYHFAGRAGLRWGTNAVRLKEIEALPVTAELRGQLAEKLAAAAWPFWQKDLPAGTTNQPALLRPLWDDFLAAEALVEVRGAPGRTDTALAIELNEERAQLWSARLKQLITAWKLGTPRDTTVEGFKGWELKRTQAPNSFQFVRAGKWVVLALAQDNSAQLPALLEAATKTGRPVPALARDFLELVVDFPGLRPWFPLFSDYPVPRVRAMMSGQGEKVRTEVRLQYSAKIPWTYEPWKIPTNLISEPLTSFTVGQGIAPLLPQVKGLSEVGLDPLPNQFCAWGIKHEQCRMYLTVPVANSTNMMRLTAPGWPKLLQSAFPHSHGEFFYVSNKAELIWGNLPFIVPHIRAERNGKDEYLFAALFPQPTAHVPVPDDLFAQLRGRTNQIYYDWELTGERVNHAKQLYQLANIVDSRLMPLTNTASARWLATVGPRLENTVTEIKQTGPQELELIRHSHVGFTGFELATLSAWLDSPGFPLTFTRPRPLGRTISNGDPGRAPRTNPSGAGAAPSPRTNRPPGGKP